MTIPIYYHTEDKYYNIWEENFRKLYLKPGHQKSDDSIKEHRLFHSSKEPKSYRFNDILGYVEITLDVQDILIYYHLNGDSRKKYNNGNLYRRNTKKIFESLTHSWGGRFKKINNKEIRDAIEHAFCEIENQCKEWKVFIHLNSYRDNLKYFDFKGYFEYKNWFENRDEY